MQVAYLKQSNTYLVLDELNHCLLEAFNNSSCLIDFSNKAAQYGDTICFESLYNDFEELTNYTSDESNDVSLQPSIPTNDSQSKTLLYKHCLISIYYDTTDTLNLIVSKFSHLITNIVNHTNPDFSKITIAKDHNRVLLDNTLDCKSWNTNNVHLFQGKFSFELLNAIHQQTEHDWIGTFHASTIGNGESAVMLVGNSGSGKSTLATLLMLNGYDLIADDMSGMLAQNNHIAVLPAAISIKEKAFSTIGELVPDFNSLPTQYINTEKGYVKFVPPNPLQQPDRLHYPCHTIVLVRYNKTAKHTVLKPGNLQTILGELISESWLAPNETHAQSFINWLETVNLYELEYSNNSEAIASVDTLF